MHADKIQRSLANHCLWIYALFVEHGAVTWPGELDLAPDAMYREIKKNGFWKLS